MTFRPGSGATEIFLPSWSTRILQASRLRPLMSIASDPHTPWAQLRRKVSEPVVLPLHGVEQPQQGLGGLRLDRVLLPVGLPVTLGVEAQDAQSDLHLSVASQYTRGLGWNVVMVTGL